MPLKSHWPKNLDSHFFRPPEDASKSWNRRHPLQFCAAAATAAAAAGGMRSEALMHLISSRITVLFLMTMTLMQLRAY